jgi:hypothetical protein
LRRDVERWCQQCDTCAASQCPWPRSWGVTHQYNVRTSFEGITISTAGPFLESKSGNQNLQITMDNDTKWPEVYTIPNQEASTMADALVINLFCVLGSWESCSDQGRNFEPQLMQAVLKHLGISKTRTTPLHPVKWHDGMISEDG